MTRPQDLPPLDQRLFEPFRKTFADLLTDIETDGTLTPVRRRDLRSSIRSFCNRLHLQAEEAPATWPTVARRIAGQHPKQLDLSLKRWQNMLSDIRFAINRYGLDPIEKIHPKDFPSSWKVLWEELEPPELRYNLSRFIRFCVRARLDPGEVTEDTFAAFERFLAEHTSTAAPRRRVRLVANTWNRAAKRIADWPAVIIKLKPARPPYTLHWEKLPRPLRLDAEHWLRLLGTDNWLDEDAPLRPLRPASIDSRRFQIRQACSILLNIGHPPEKMDSLSYLVHPAHAEEVLTFFWERAGGKPSSQAAGVASCLQSIARHHAKLSEPDIKKFLRMKGHVTPSTTGLSSKNRAMLRQFDDPANIERLLQFPVEAMKRAVRLLDESPGQAALLARLATVVEILLMMPIRLKNLAHLHLEQNFDWRGERLFIVIPSETVKNDEPIEFELLSSSANLVKLYLERFRPILTNGSGYLFPGKLPGRPTNPTHLSRWLSKRLFAELGLSVTTHQFRHIAAKFWLDENPGSYEVVRRILHHRSIDTTTASYTGFETRAAALHYDQFILKQRSRYLEFRGSGNG